MWVFLDITDEKNCKKSCTYSKTHCERDERTATREVVSLSLSSHYQYRIRLIAAESIDAGGTCTRYAIIRVMLQQRYIFPQAARR